MRLCSRGLRAASSVWFGGVGTDWFWTVGFDGRGGRSGWTVGLGGRVDGRGGAAGGWVFLREAV